MKPLVVGNLIIKKPVVQGGMGVGISLGNLAGAVAKAGGMGTISTAQIGFLEDDFEEHPMEANLRAIPKELEKARKIAPTGVIGFNIMVATRNYAEYAKAAVKAGADFIVSGAGLPTNLPKIVGAAKVKLAPIVSSAKSAGVILKYWDKKYDKIPDFVVIEGPEAGGHLGFSREELEEYKKESYTIFHDEVRKIQTVIHTFEEKYRKKIPVVLGGGIYDNEDAKKAFSLGVDGIQVATRFITSQECDADIRYKEAYINAKEEDIVIVKSPVGMPGRAIKNPMIKKVSSGERIPVTKCRQCLAHCNPQEIPYCITEALIQAARGNTDKGLLFCGAKAWKACKLESVEEILDALLKDLCYD